MHTRRWPHEAIDSERIVRTRRVYVTRENRQRALSISESRSICNIRERSHSGCAHSLRRCYTYIRAHTAQRPRHRRTIEQSVSFSLSFSTYSTRALWMCQNIVVYLIIANIIATAKSGTVFVGIIRGASNTLVNITTTQNDIRYSNISSRCETSDDLCSCWWMSKLDSNSEANNNHSKLYPDKSPRVHVCVRIESECCSLDRQCVSYVVIIHITTSQRSLPMAAIFIIIIQVYVRSFVRSLMKYPVVVFVRSPVCFVYFSLQSFFGLPLCSVVLNYTRCELRATCVSERTWQIFKVLTNHEQPFALNPHVWLRYFFSVISVQSTDWGNKWKFKIKNWWIEFVFLFDSIKPFQTKSWVRSMEI